MQKALRFDLLIAVCALLISAIASTASVYQTRVIADQFSATVWPYLDFQLGFRNGQIQFSLQNDRCWPAHFDVTSDDAPKDVHSCSGGGRIGAGLPTPGAVR